MFVIRERLYAHPVYPSNTTDILINLLSYYVVGQGDVL